MKTITALSDTYIKKELIEADKLPSDKKKFIAKGDNLVIESAKREGNHYLCKLAYGSGDWYIFSGHWSNPETQEIGKGLTEQDFIEAAKSLRCEVAVIKAIVEVEASGSGFLSNGKPKILFEAHLFSKLTSNKFDVSHPRLSSKRWNRSLYKGGQPEWDRLEAAMKLDRRAAIQSASYGLFQILGMNYKACGYIKPEDYFNDQFVSEAIHLKCFINFIKANKLDGFLRSKNFTSFARRYNGPSFATHGYHIKLQKAYTKFKK